MSGPRETALAAMALQLESIKVANGYANDIAKVLRIDFRADQLNDNDIPTAFVLPPLGGGRLDAMDAAGYFYRMPVTCGVLAKTAVTDAKDGARETTMESLVNDLWRALLQDPTFGGAVKESVLQDGPYFVDPDAGIGVYNCTLQVDLVFQRSSL